MIRLAAFLLLASVALQATAAPRFARLPDGAVQPDAAVDAAGVLHVVYLVGEPRAADVFYVRSSDRGETFSEPVRVNREPGVAIAAGTIRGAQIALGREGAVHVVWNGSSSASLKGPRDPAAKPEAAEYRSPVTYARRPPGESAFEPERNLMTRSYVLDGGAAVAADSQGRVYVGWHARAADAEEGEAGRRVWIARSHDDGAMFSPEEAVFGAGQGACACCQLELFADAAGLVRGLYRSARDVVHRDVFRLLSEDAGKTFQGTPLDEWKIAACPMSSMDFVEFEGKTSAAWETAGQVYFSRIDADEVAAVSPGGPAENRKHPRLAANPRGETLLVWTETGGWGKPGVLKWRVFNAAAEPVEAGGGERIPVWSFAAAAAVGDVFLVIH